MFVTFNIETVYVVPKHYARSVVLEMCLCCEI